MNLPTLTIEGGPAPAEPPTSVQAVMPEPGQVAITDPDGSVSLVAQQDLPQALQEGARPATRHEYWREKEANTLSGQIMSGATGFARGLSFGFSDPAYIAAARAFGGESAAADTREYLNVSREANRGTSIGGEVVGSLASMFLIPGGGAGQAAKATSALGRAAERAVAIAPRAFGEGALMGVGHQASEDALGNHELVAENYWSAGLKGGLVGALLGAGVSAGAGAIADRFGSRLASSGAERTAYRTAEPVADMAAKPTLSGRLGQMAEEQAAKAVLPSASLLGSEVQKLGRTADQQLAKVRRIGRTLLDEGIVTSGASTQQIASRVTQRVNEVGRELGAIRKTLDKATVRPSTATIAERVEKEVIAPLEALPGTSAEVGAVRSYMKDFVAKAGDSPSFEKIQKFRKALDEKLDPKLWAKNPGSAPPAAVEMGKVRRVIEEEVESAAERAGAELGDAVAGKYRTAKALFADLKQAEKWVTKTVARRSQNRGVSLTDTIAGVGGIGTAVTGGTPLPLLMPVANHLMRTRGNQFAAGVLERASKLQLLANSAARAEEKIAAGSREFLTGKKAAPKATKALTSDDVRSLREAVRDGETVAERVATSLGDIGQTAPRVAGLAAVTAMRAAAYLRATLPKEPPPVRISFGEQKTRPIDRQELTRAAQIVEVVNDPTVVLDRLKEGRLSRVHVEALKAVHPETYGAIKRAIRENGVELRAQLTPQEEIRLGLLFDEPLSSYMQPRAIADYQAAFNKMAPAPAKRGGAPEAGGSGANYERRTSVRSGFDRVEEP